MVWLKPIVFVQNGFIYFWMSDTDDELMTTSAVFIVINSLKQKLLKKFQ